MPPKWPLLVAAVAASEGGGSTAGSNGGAAGAWVPDMSVDGCNGNHRLDELILDLSIRENCEAWTTIDDRVMGGSSRSAFNYMAAGTAAGVSYRPSCRFEGTLETTDGGFASARWVPQDWRWLQERLEGASGLMLRAQGDGRVGYKLNLWNDFSLSNPFSQVSYQQGFEPNVGAPDDKWPNDDVILPFSDFVPRAILRDATAAPPLRGAEVRQLGLMLSRFPPFAAGLPNTTGELVTDGKFWLKVEKVYAYHCTADADYSRANATASEWWDEWSKNVQSWWLTQTMDTQVLAQHPTRERAEPRLTRRSSSHAQHMCCPPPMAVARAPSRRPSPARWVRRSVLPPSG